MKTNNFQPIPTAIGGMTHKELKMEIFNSGLNYCVKPDGFALHLLEDTMPGWLYKGLRKDMVNSLRGFNEDVALEIADDLIDCWSGHSLHLTGIGHIDAMLWGFYCRILNCAHRKHIEFKNTK